MIYRASDGVLLREVYAECGGVTGRLSQPGREAILEKNARAQIERPNRDLTFGRMVLNIPFLDRHVLRTTHPELDAPDKEIRTAAWVKFIASSESRPFRCW